MFNSADVHATIANVEEDSLQPLLYLPMLLTAVGVVTKTSVSIAVNICMGAAGQEQVGTANQPQQLKAGSRKKQRGGKKAAAKGGKGTRTASGSIAQAADLDEEVTVEFFVPADKGGTDFELRGQYPTCCPICQQVFSNF